MKQSRMAFLSIKLVIIENNSSSMHREYHDFYAVHVYLRSIRISLVDTTNIDVNIGFLCMTFFDVIINI